MQIECVLKGKDETIARRTAERDELQAANDALEQQIDTLRTFNTGVLDALEQVRAERDVAVAALRQAQEDLTIWHTETGAYQEASGGIAWAACDGCDTCQVTLPMIDNALAPTDKQEAI